MKTNKEQGKKPNDSLTIMTQVVLPNDTNPLGILMGGVMLNWMDMASAICAQRHAGSHAVTVAVDKVSFKVPVYSGDIVEIIAKVSRVFNTSMEVIVEVEAENILKQEKKHTHRATYTYVALDKNNKPTKAPQLVRDLNKNISEFDLVLKRRTSRKTENVF
jgi:acyl-CoA hydrolase